MYSRVSFLLIVQSLFLSLLGSSAITHRPLARFGDNLLGYYKAKWLSYKYKIPFLYQPFTYSDQLVMHEKEESCTRDCLHRFKHSIELKDEYKLVPDRRSGTLYVVSYYSRLIDWMDDQVEVFPKQLDKHFWHEIKQLVRPRRKIKAPYRPEGLISIAVHVRKGGGYDTPLLSDQSAVVNSAVGKNYADVAYPTKFPPDSYYIEQIATVWKLFNKQPLYIYIFTDDRDPGRLADKYAKELNVPNITFDYRRQGNAHDANVIDDFFAMMEFDGLIRADSSYSKAAQLLADFQIVISPEHYSWQKNTLIIDKVKTVFLGEV
jgi:hypothetical protein